MRGGEAEKKGTNVGKEMQRGEVDRKRWGEIERGMGGGGGGEGEMGRDGEIGRLVER